MEKNTAGSKEEIGQKTAKSRSGGKASDVPKDSGEAKKKFEIDIFKGWCKSCGICAAFCPRECIRMDEDGSTVVENSERCTGCGWCEVHCPDFAISVNPARKAKVREQDD